MAIGKGRWDDLLTEAREKAEAPAGILLIFKEGEWGFSVQAPPEALMSITRMLRHIADTIDRDALVEKDIIDHAMKGEDEV